MVRKRDQEVMEDRKSDIWLHELKPPFIKVTDMSGEYRPLFIEGLKNWSMTVQDYVSYLKERDGY